MASYPIKKIFVSIEEFENQGGVLKEGREIFTIDRPEHSYPIGTYLGYDKEQKVHLVKNARYKSFPISSMNQVEIEVTPIWK